MAKHNEYFQAVKAHRLIHECDFHESEQVVRDYMNILNGVNDDEWKALVVKGLVLNAIKHYRSLYSATLKEAKEAIDNYKASLYIP